MFQNLQGFIESPIFDIKKQYASYGNVLKGAKQGEVVTRFPPEPSGYLHIGHLKAALLNYHYAKMYNGKVLLRFDDTNPVTEKDEYVESIIEDLKLVKFFPDSLSYTSDYFDKFQETMTQMIKDGKAYCDNTELEKMRDERTKKIDSKCRNQTPEENLKIWEKLVAGDENFRQYCVRGKVNMQSNNGCMRDPVFYRAVYDEKTKSFIPHHRTGTKYKVYPTYDFACPIIDSLEGVTHALRTTEYTDRNEQYKWVQKALGVREVHILGFSRLSMVNTVFSKRKLKWFVETGRVDGWDDPRFPTIRGILKRGIRVETLIELMLEQGPSKADVNMEWDKLWAINRKIIDPIAIRYSAISLSKPCKLRVTNQPDVTHPQCKVFPAHPKTPQLGNVISFISNNFLIEFDDAKLLKETDKVTLMGVGNVQLAKITQLPDGSYELFGEFLKDDKDFKNTYKLSWVCGDAPLAKVNLVEYDHLLKCKKLEDDMKFEDVLNENTKQVTEAVADPSVRNLQLGQIIQFQRRGFFILDKYINDQNTGDRISELIYIPDGKLTNMTKNITTKIDQKAVIKGADMKTNDTEAKDKSPQKKSKKQKAIEKNEQNKQQDPEQQQNQNQKKKEKQQKKPEETKQQQEQDKQEQK